MEAQEKLNSIKVWITLSIPKVEDGNNFGVSVQEEVLGEVVKCEGDIVSYLDQINRYFVTRAKMASKVAKYPMIEDYRQAVDEYDQKVFHNLRVILQELRNTYLLVHDLVVKNVDKIRHPRSANMGALY
jgi:proteasome activator subunit 3 (PA28 gamma)